MNLLFVVLGLILLILGGNWLLKSAVGFSLRLNIPKIVIGMTVVSFATSAPELIVSVKSALNGHADIAFGNVIEASPATQDAYVYRARTNTLIGDDAQMINYYQQYIDIVTKKGPEEMAKAAVKGKLIEAYNTMAAGYANTDKVKAIEFFNKTLAIDPENGYALQSVEMLKKK